MIEEDIYTWRPLPWMSKSAVLSHRFCEWSFYRRYLLGEDSVSSKKARTGTNMHAVAALWFKRDEERKIGLYIKELVKLPINYEEYIVDTVIYQYMLKSLNEYLPQSARNYKPYKIILRNLALIEAEHWISLNEKFNGNMPKVLRYFVPTSVEKYIEDPNTMLYGTLDRKNAAYRKNKDLIEILDYKTGHVAKMVKDCAKEVVEEYRWTLPTDKSFELHFYLLLDLLNRGYTLHPDIVAYLTEPKCFAKDFEFKASAIKPYFYKPDGKPYKFTDDYRIGIIFLGSDEGPFVAKKKSTRVSMGAVFRAINGLRGKLYRKEGYNKEPNYFKCRECGLIQDCLDSEERKILGLEDEEETTQAL